MPDAEPCSIAEEVHVYVHEKRRQAHSSALKTRF